MAIVDAYFNTGGVNCLQVLPTTPVKLYAEIAFDGTRTWAGEKVKAGIKVKHDGSTQEFEFYTRTQPLLIGEGNVTFETDTIYLAAPQTNLHIVWVTAYDADTGITIEAGAPPGTSPNSPPMCTSVNVIQAPAGATIPNVYEIITTPETPKAGDAVTIKARIVNRGPSGKVRAVFKVGGTQISDQNSTLNTFPAGGYWEPTAPYTMPSSTITISVEAYGWNGSNWVLTETKSITRTPSVTPCTNVNLTPFSASIKTGEKVTFTAAVTPSSPFTVQFKDRAGTLLGTCTTSGGSCTFIWDSAGKQMGTYYVRAYAVEGNCVSTEATIQVSPPINQWNVNIYAKDSVTGSPVAGASVVVGTQSKLTDTAGYVQFRVDEGTINVSISKTGYNTYTTVELVFVDRTFNYVIAPAGIAKGSIHFVSLPEGAEIFIDGADQGVRTSYTVTDIPSGDHAFTLKLAGYNDFAGSVTVAGGSVIEVYVQLTPLSTGAGALYIASMPVDADVTLDGQAQNVKTPINITNLPAGSHTVKLTKTGYQDFTQTVTITAGTTAYLSATLTVLPGIGTAEISSTPAGARVYVDNADAQRVTPAVITNLSSGDHAYRLVLSGYRDAAGKFSIESGKTTAVSVPMVKEGLSSGTLGLVAALAVGAVAVVAVVASRISPDNQQTNIIKRR